MALSSQPSIWVFPDIPEEEYPLTFIVGGQPMNSQPQERPGTELGRELASRWASPNCPFCSVGSLQRFSENVERVEEKVAFVCSNCGWWKAQRIKWWGSGAAGGQYTFQGSAVLKQLNLNDINAPIEEIEQYIRIHYEKRFDVHPQRWEALVADVFAGLGYQSRVTGYSNDGGIDIILDKSGETIGVQVKRYRNVIKVEQIRSLAGALVLAGLTSGMFVTTSSFQSGAMAATQQYLKRGYRIELLDAESFFNALALKKRNMYRLFKDFSEHGFFEMLPEISRSIS